LDKSAEKTNTSELCNLATGETELYLSIENTIEERLRAFNKKLRHKHSRTRMYPASRRQQNS